LNNNVPTILTIDDEKAIRLSFKEYLTDFGYNVITAENGRIGINVFREKNPSLILCDLRMPEVDGLEVIRVVSEESPETPIIVVSGTGVITDVIEALHRGAWDYILKPIKNLSELTHVIKTNLEKSQLKKENREYQDHLEIMVAQKTAELKKSEYRLDSIVKTVPDIIYRLDKHGNISFISDAVTNYGYTIDELIGENILELVHPSYLESVKYKINERRTGDRKTRDLEVVLLTKNKEAVPFELRYSDLLFTSMFLVEAEGIYNNNVHKEKEFIGTQGILRDISKRKETEQNLKESEERFRLLIDYAPDLIQIWDKNGKFVQVNQQTCKILGYKNEEIITFNINQISPSLEKKCNELNIWDYKPGAENITFETIYINNKSIEFPIELKLGIIMLKNEKYVMAFGRDITDRKEAEKKKLDLEKQLRQAQKMEAIGTLAGGIAHDFNNMLTPILGYSDLIKEDLDKESFAYKSLIEVQNAATRAADLVKQILTFSRQKEKKREIIKISSIIKEAMKLLRGSIPPTIKIKSHIKSNPLPIMADATQIHQIVMNICTNSYQAMENEDGELSIKLEDFEVKIPIEDRFGTIPINTYNKITISDTGSGIDDEIQEHIFEPYFTTKDKEKGTGLGLATVHGIVKNNNGYISLSSKKNVGTTFEIYFPVPITISENIEKEYCDQINVRGNESILLVDDEKNVLLMMEKGLESYGYNVNAFLESREAYKNFVENPEKYDIIILDQIMPELSGLKFAKLARKIKPNIPIIINSGFNNAISEEETKYFSFFFMKPMRICDIAEGIRKLLDK